MGAWPGSRRTPRGRSSRSATPSSDAPTNCSAAEAASPASFHPLKAQTRAGARRPSGRLSHRRGCIRVTVQDARVAIAALQAGQQVDAVFACTRKDRLVTRTGTPYLALELRDRTGTVAARAFRDADVLAGRFDRGDLVRVRGRVDRYRDELQIEVAAIDRVEAPDADPSAFLPTAYRDLDELDGFLEHLAGEVSDPGLPRAARRDAGRRGAARGSPSLAVHARRPPRLPRRAAGAHGRGGHARPGDVHPARPARRRPAADGGDRARHRQDAGVHVRRPTSA